MAYKISKNSELELKKALYNFVNYANIILCTIMHRRNSSEFGRQEKSLKKTRWNEHKQ